MFASSKFIYFLFSFLSAVLVGRPPAMAANSNFFSEYIGALFTGVKFTDVPINPNVQFHFILAFGIDYTTSTSPPSPTNGQFNIFWDSNTLSAQAIADIKSKNPNVRVALSLGGASVSGTPVDFTATNVDSWVSNAVASLTDIINQYGIDGIDIDYETFASDEGTFTECIGRLITTLKNNGAISFASIAPFDDPPVQSHYQALWAQYANVIDYVNFQFYGYDSTTTAEQYVNYFNQQLDNYKGSNLLASFITNDGSKVTPDTVLAASQTLKAENKFFGIFAWTADQSPFTYETQAQDLLVG